MATAKPQPIIGSTKALSGLLEKDTQILKCHWLGPAGVSVQAIVRSAINLCVNSFVDVTRARRPQNALTGSCFGSLRLLAIIITLLRSRTALASLLCANQPAQSQCSEVDHLIADRGY
jgi:hypothetical protein